MSNGSNRAGSADSMAESSEERYEDILKRIAERKPFRGQSPENQPAKPHERVLDQINAYDCLADIARRQYASWTLYGPMSLRGAAWAGLMIWAHRKGYHGYKRLSLHGVWAHYAGDQILLSIGSRQLTYNAPVYDPGVYRVAIAKNFRIYYADSGAPPAAEETVLCRVDYHDQDRLQHRQTLVDIARQWRREFAGA